MSKRAVILIGVAVGIAGIAAFAIRMNSLERRDVFVTAFVSSAYEGTGDHEAFVNEEEREEIARSLMAQDFKITRRDGIGSGVFEYVVVFSNGRSGIVAFRDEGGQMSEARLFVERIE